MITAFLPTKQTEAIEKLIDCHESSISSQTDEAICKFPSMNSSMLSESNKDEQSLINTQSDSSRIQPESNNGEPIKIYDNPYDELIDFINAFIKRSIKNSHLEPKHEAPEIYNINNFAYQVAVSKYKDVLAQVACIYVYNDDFNNSKKDYDEWINEKISTFFIIDKEKGRYKYEMKMKSNVDEIIDRNDVEKNFLELLLNSIVVSLYLCINNQIIPNGLKTTDQYYPDDEDYHWYSYIFDITYDALLNLRKNLEYELEVLGSPAVLEQFEF